MEEFKKRFSTDRAITVEALIPMSRDTDEMDNRVYKLQSYQIKLEIIKQLPTVKALVPNGIHVGQL